MFRIIMARGTSSTLPRQLRRLSSSSPRLSQDVTSTLYVEKDSENPSSLPPSPRGKLVSAAFNQLQSLEEAVEVDDAANKMISEAKDLKSLLTVVTKKKLTRNHALKLVSVLADWTVEGKVKTSDFEKDKRFVAVCNILGSKPLNDQTVEAAKKTQGSDLTTVLGVASDDEAAKLIASISLQQMIKVLSTLASKKRRSTPLLRSLAHNIAASSEKLDIKQGADALYAVAILNYHDEMLVDRLCADLCLCLPDNSRRAVVGSIITSLGILRYKHTDILNLLCEWVEKHLEICQTQDLSSLLMTLAVVNHTPSNQETLLPILLEQLKDSGVANPLEWLDVVYALTILKKQTNEHVSSVLSTEFIDKIKTISSDLSIPTKLKLLNINGAAKLKLKSYEGPLLDTSLEEWKVPLTRSKEKQALVTAVHETMLNLLPSAVYLNTNIETEMGFIIDGEIMVNAKLTPLPLFDKKTKAPIDRTSSDMQRGIKVAILVWDYFDMTKGRNEPTGVNILTRDLLHLKGYRTMCVDYIDFNPRHKLVSRVQHLGNLLKSTRTSSVVGRESTKSIMVCPLKSCCFGYLDVKESITVIAVADVIFNGFVIWSTLYALFNPGLLRDPTIEQMVGLVVCILIFSVALVAGLIRLRSILKNECVFMLLWVFVEFPLYLIFEAGCLYGAVIAENNSGIILFLLMIPTTIHFYMVVFSYNCRDGRNACFCF